MEPILNKKYIKNAVKKAKKILHNGGLVIFPTETVYGIGANATNPIAIKRIYEIKNRSYNNPLICHFQSLEKIKNEFEMSEVANKLADCFWPGPLTLILKKKKSSIISPNLSNYKEFVGCRIPHNPIANELLESVPFPIAAPSANISTKLSTTNIKHLDNKLKNKVFFINGGNSRFGLESTVLNVSSKHPKILRYGSITLEQLKKIIPDIYFLKNHNSKFLSPGQQKKHYSPNIPLRINVNKVLEGEVLLNFGKNNLKSKIFELNLSVSGNLDEAGKNLYDYLHQLDKQEYKGIAVAPIPNNDLGKTINDRLIRAIVNGSS